LRQKRGNMAAFNKKTVPERFVLHGLLIGFSMVFFFPFLWMICNSVKVQEEMVSSRFQLFPRAPHVVDRTPYIDIDEFYEIEPLDGVSAKVWEKVEPELKKMIIRELKKWRPILPGGVKSLVIPENYRQKYLTAMTRGVFYILANRISDKAREAALREHHRIYREEFPEIKKVPGELHEKAVKIGRDMLIKDFRQKITNSLLSEVLDRVFRRLCLGAVKVRSGHEIKIIDSERGWQTVSDSVTLEPRKFHNIDFKLARIDYDKDRSAVFTYNLLPEESENVNRIYIGYRGDSSWARIQFEVIRGGWLYRTTEVINAHSPNWSEAELRWDTEVIDPTERRTFYFLENTGQEKLPVKNLQIRVKVIKSGIVLAWYDKLLRSYRTVFREVPFLRYIMTSLCLCIINIVLTVFSCSFVAYAFSRLEWPGRNIFFGIMLATMMIPGQVIMIPGFLINRYLGLYNTLVPLWLFSAFGSAFFIFLLRQFMMTIPKDLEDAARIDGCGFLGIYWHVILPLIKPTTATIAIFTFTANWNNFMGPLIYVNDERLFPLALGLFKFNLISGADTGLMMAGSFIMTLPIIILFFYAQKYFIQGVTLTGTKG
jgi:multiple sugar transport system permease protein